LAETKPGFCLCILCWPIRPDLFRQNSYNIPLFVSQSLGSCRSGHPAFFASC